MAWIESHTSLDKHHKVIRLRLAMRWSKNETIGFLHRFWWTVLEVSPSGDITALSSPEVMAEMLDMPVEAVAKALKVMEDDDPKFAFLERKGGRLLVHDWLDYAGRYLSESKFKRNPGKMVEIRNIHGQSTDSPRIVPDTNQPTNQPTKPNSAQKEIFDIARKAYPGTKRTVDPELSDFWEKFGGRADGILPLLLPAVRGYVAHLKKKTTTDGKPAMVKAFKTWIAEEGWTTEYPGASGIVDEAGKLRAQAHKREKGFWPMNTPTAWMDA